MKKVFLLVFTLALFTGCQNEPLDDGFAGLDNPTGPENPGGSTNSDDLKLSSYKFNVDTAIPILGDFTLNTNFVMNTDNRVATLDVNSLLLGTAVVGSGTITRDGSGKVITFKSFEGTTQQNQTNITYNGNDISSIEYDDLEDDTEDYTYTFTTTGNVTTRTSSASSKSVEYTFNSDNQLTKKESTEAGSILQTELLTYDAAGNCTNVVTTGENNNTTTYGFDAFTNPLKEAFSDQFRYSIFEADYDDEAGPNIVQFFGTNNWSSITTADGQVTFAMSYNASNRIISRIGNYDLGDGVTINQEELFNYVN